MYLPILQNNVQQLQMKKRKKDNAILYLKFPKLSEVVPRFVASGNLDKIIIKLLLFSVRLICCTYSRYLDNIVFSSIKYSFYLTYMKTDYSTYKII